MDAREYQQQDRQYDSTYTGSLNLSTIVLIVTGIYAVLGLVFIVAAILVNENRLKNKNNGGTTGGTTGGTGPTGFICSGPGSVPQIGPPPYQRISPRSSAQTPVSNYDPPFTSKSHTVQKSYRARSLNAIVSPNHWIGNALYGTNSSFNVYPYHGRIGDDGFTFSWPTSGVLTEHCSSSSGSCPTGNANLLFNVNTGTSLSMCSRTTSQPVVKIGSSAAKPLACDIVDIDALVATVVWQYQNNVTQKVGSMTIPLARGSPFITSEINNIDVSIECGFDFTVTSLSESTMYVIQRNNDGYVLILSQALSPSVVGSTIYIPSFSGVLRIAYFDSQTMLDILVNNYSVYPIESTIRTSATLDTDTIWNVDTTFEWTTKRINKTSDVSPLMLALPHHNIVNVVYESDLMFHPLIGPFRLLTTDDTSWTLAEAVANYTFNYPPVGTTGSDSLSSVWENEIVDIVNSPPADAVNWFKWLGSLATLLLIGDMLGKNIAKELDILKNNLSLIKTRNGALSPYNTFIHDDTWGGVISHLGLDNCVGNSDYGNAFYQSHVGQFGYLVFAYSVAGHFDQEFINNNKDTALLFVRDIANPYEFDDTFPLWRNKDWYFGYSISSGLSPQQGRGKETSDIGESILGYYASYLLSSLFDDQKELMNWSLAMLASEITSLQYYFQFVSQNRTDVDPAFVQGTIVERGDTFYDYASAGGNVRFPARNASLMVPILKPLSLISFDYLDKQWLQFIQFWIAQAASSPDIEAESLAYSQAILSVQASPQSQQSIVDIITDNSDIYLPYGSTWSSVLYWVLAQQQQ